MILDAHCHFDMMSNPEKYIRDVESRGDYVIGMTNLPSHFEMGWEHTKGFKRVRLALGFHPQLAAESQRELLKFVKLVDKTSYIGEIGLDFSRESYASKDVQISSLRTILEAIKGKNKIISVHSRRAEKEMLALLREFDIQNVIFHWYSGPVGLVREIVDAGYYFSVNEAMTLTPNGQKIINAIPRERILTETDAPYNERTSIKAVLNALNMTEQDVMTNFNALIKNIQKR